VVHNGIITNYKALKETLVRKGFTFESDTDTEVVPKLCKFVYDRLAKEGEKVPFRQLVMEVIRKLEGAYALIFKSVHYPGELVACKRGSPLLLGVKEHVGWNIAPNGKCMARSPKSEEPKDEDAAAAEIAMPEYFLASDASAVVEHTKSVLVMEDDDVVHIRKGWYGCFRCERGGHGSDSEGPPMPIVVHRALELLDMEVEEIMKGDYDHYMQKEIHEQPESLTETMRGRVIGVGIPGGYLHGDEDEESLRGRARIVLGGLKDHFNIMRRSRRLIFVGCGTSYHSCLAARHTMEELTEAPVSIELASDLVDRSAPIFRDDTVIFVSQSGETADTLHALEYAKKHGALCVGVTNTVGSAIARGTDCGVHINAGAEIGVASTKAYTSQIVVLVMIALSLSEDSLSKHERRQAVIRDLGLLPEVVRRVLAMDQAIKTLAQELVDQQSLLIVGRGGHYATALEGALKVKEVSLMHSEGVLAGEVKHGVLALVDENLPIILIATRDENFQKQMNVFQQLKARAGRLTVIVSEEEDHLQEDPHLRLIRVPTLCSCLQGIVNIVPLQLLAYHLTVLRGFNVDQPRNLAKSVTVV